MLLVKIPYLDLFGRSFSSAIFEKIADQGMHPTPSRVVTVVTVNLRCIRCIHISGQFRSIQVISSLCKHNGRLYLGMEKLHIRAGSPASSSGGLQGIGKPTKKSNASDADGHFDLDLGDT